MECTGQAIEKPLDILLHDPERNAKALERLHQVEAAAKAMEEQNAKEQKEKMDLLEKRLAILNQANRLRNSQSRQSNRPLTNRYHSVYGFGHSAHPGIGQSHHGETGHAHRH